MFKSATKTADHGRRLTERGSRASAGKHDQLRVAQVLFVYGMSTFGSRGRWTLDVNNMSVGVCKCQPPPGSNSPNLRPCPVRDSAPTQSLGSAWQFSASP